MEACKASSLPVTNKKSSGTGEPGAGCISTGWVGRHRRPRSATWTSTGPSPMKAAGSAIQFSTASGTFLVGRPRAGFGGGGWQLLFSKSASCCGSILPAKCKRGCGNLATEPAAAARRFDGDGSPNWGLRSPQRGGEGCNQAKHEGDTIEIDDRMG